MIDTMLRMEPDFPTSRLAGLTAGKGADRTVLGHRLAHSLFEAQEREFQYTMVSSRPIAMLVRSERPLKLEAGWSARSKPAAPELRAGSTLEVLVKVVAEIQEHRGEGTRGKRRDVVSVAMGWADHIGKPEEEIRHAAAVYWFGKVGERQGFKLVRDEAGSERLVVRDRERVAFKHKTGTIQAHPLTVEAQIEVTDPVAFRSVVENGIGRLRSYGFGLVQLKAA